MVRPLLEVLLQIVGFAAIAAWMFTRPQRSSYSSLVAFVLGVAGALVFVDGFRLGVLEESRTRYGRVVSGVWKICAVRTAPSGVGHA